MAVAQRSDGTWLNWREFGPPDGEPVLLVMGLAGSGRAWWRLIPHLETDHRVIAFDNRGTGDSDRVAGVMTVPEMARDARAVLDAAGIERAHVIGASMGGMIAQQLALSARERVRSLVLMCTTPGGPRYGGLPWRLLASAALKPAFGPGSLFALVAPALYSPTSRATLGERIEQDKALRVRDATPALTSLAQMAGVARWDVRPRLRELAGLEVTVMHGADDVLMNPRHSQEMARIIPGARLFMIPGCGHLLTTEAEEPVARIVREHLARAARPSSQPA